MSIAMTYLAEQPLFRNFTPPALRTLAGLFGLARFGAGEQLFAQGAPADKVYVLHTGEVDLRLYPEDGGTLTIAHLEPGGVFGWSAALGRTRYTSAAVSVLAGEALVIRGSDLRALVKTDETTGYLVLGRMALTVAGRPLPAEASAAEAQRLAQIIRQEMSNAGS